MLNSNISSFSHSMYDTDFSDVLLNEINQKHVFSIIIPKIKLKQKNGIHQSCEDSILHVPVVNDAGYQRPELHELYLRDISAAHRLQLLRLFSYLLEVC